MPEVFLSSLSTVSKNGNVKKYHFDQLEIDDYAIMSGDGPNIRSSASTWGRRYGIWLSVTKHGKKWKITRLPGPLNFKREAEHRRYISLEEAINKQHDALRTLTLLVLGLKKTIEQEFSPEQEKIVYDPYENRT